MADFTIEDVRNSFRDINLIDETATILQDNADLLIEMNKDQLMHGMDAEGKPMPELSERYDGGRYKEEKLRMNPEANGRWDIRLTGSTQDSMVLKLSNDSYEITSNDPKTDELKDKARKRGAIIFGIDPQNEEGVIDNIIQPQLVDRIADLTLSDAQ
jgi:hypothetical protein